MLCSGFAGLVLAGRRLECGGGEAGVWAFWLALAAVLATFALAVRDRRPAPFRILTAGLFAAGFLALAFAIERPQWTRELERGGGGAIFALLDGSESFWREEASARRALDLAAERIEAFLAARPPEEAALWRGRLFVFGRSAEAEGPELSAENLAGALRRRRAERPAERSDLNAGLRAVLAELRAAGGERMAILLTDGLASPPLDEGLLDEFRALGAPIHVLGAGSSAPAAGLVAADLGPERRVGEEAVLRGSVLGAGVARIEQDGRTETLAIAEEGLHARPLRLTTRFPSRGLHGVRLSFASAEGEQGRDLFTLVRGPARVLVYGAAPWADSLPPGRWAVERADPRRPLAPRAYDLVAIDALTPQDFPPGYDRELLAAADGAGILIVNGGLRGAREEAQRISDWSRSALNPILPADGDPRAFVEEPPPRDVVIMVDVSGSMAGARLGSAQSAISAILRQLRPQDTVAILPFSDGPMRGLDRTHASAEGLEAARRFTAALRASGGTEASGVLRASGRFATNYCGFFFISDGDFTPPSVAPQCFTTAISVSNRLLPIDVRLWGEQIPPLGEGGGADHVALRYFEPQERDAFFREGAFRPQSADGDPRFAAAPQVEGLAVAYPRQDARVELLHEAPPPDPLYVWRRDSQRPGVAAGMFLGAMGPEWGEGGASVVEAMLERLLAWPDEGRHLVRVSDLGGSYRLSVIQIDDQAPIQEAALSADFAWSDGRIVGVSLRRDPRSGAFVGEFAPPSGHAGGKAWLTLREGTRTQRIPSFFPARGDSGILSAEALNFGLDEAALTLAARRTLGLRLESERLPEAAARDAAIRAPFHHWLIALAFLAFAFGIWSRDLPTRLRS